MSVSLILIKTIFMKKFILSFTLCLIVIASANAQASEKGNVVVTPSIGLGAYGYYGYGGFGIPVNLNVDFNVHDYASVGPWASFFTKKYSGDDRYTGIGVGARGLFHWWQLLDDKVDKDLKADKLDIYWGLSFGYNIGTYKYSNDDSKYKDNYFSWGSGLGLRYYFTEKFGVSAEFGYLGNSWLKVGFPIKF